MHTSFRHDFAISQHCVLSRAGAPESEKKKNPETILDAVTNSSHDRGLGLLPILVSLLVSVWVMLAGSAGERAHRLSKVLDVRFLGLAAATPPGTPNFFRFSVISILIDLFDAFCMAVACFFLFFWRSMARLVEHMMAQCQRWLSGLCSCMFKTNRSQI